MVYFSLTILPLMYLDMYYLALETFYRQEYNALRTKYKDGGLNMENVYDMESPEGKLDIFYQFRSKSVWPFYSLHIIVAGLIGCFLAHPICCQGA